MRNAPVPVGESFLETAFLRLLIERGLPLPEIQVEVEAGGALYRVDCLFRNQRLVVELKGHGTHSTRAELNHDSAREAALLTLGLRVVSFTYDHVMSQPDLVVDRLSKLLDPDLRRAS